MAEPATTWASTPTNPIDVHTVHQITTMDGIITLQAPQANGDQLWIAEFSYGGNPPTIVSKPSAPISAGSTDGNLMIFSKLDTVPQPSDPIDPENYKTKIVTTRNYGEFKNTTVVNIMGAEVQAARPASYLYSVAASDKVDVARFCPTMIMYYDSNALENERDLIVHRYDLSMMQWQPIATYLPIGASYAAIPIDIYTAPKLVDPDFAADRIEYYRLFAIPTTP